MDIEQPSITDVSTSFVRTERTRKYDTCDLREPASADRSFVQNLGFSRKQASYTTMAALFAACGLRRSAACRQISCTLFRPGLITLVRNTCFQLPLFHCS